MDENDLLIDAIKSVESSKVTIVIGVNDTGKSSLIKKISEYMDISIIDSDIGQSDIGPPSVISLGERIGGKYEMIDGYFCGSTTPAGHLLQMIAGVSRMMKKVRNFPVVINTTGLATGSIGRALKSQKIAAVMPDNIIAIEYDDELKYLDMYEKMGINVMHLPVFTGVRQKSKNERIQLRQASFYEHFFYAETIEAPFHYTGFERTLINNGECINVNRMFPDHPDIAYAEKGANEAVVILDRPIKNIMSVLKPLETRNITLYRSSDLNRLLTGLIDSNGVFKGLGIIRSINFRDRLITIFSRAESFSCIQFGSIKIDENDFSYKGSLTPDTLKLY